MTDIPQPIRPLGPCEVYSSSRHALGFYRCLANTCRYAVPWSALHGSSVPDVMEAAVANLVLRLPRLSMAITGDEASCPYFAAVPSLDLSYHLECVELPAGLDSQARDTHLLHLLEAQHDQLWPDVGTRPPWRVLAVHDPQPSKLEDRLVLDVMLAIHHSLADGRSTAIFQTNLLDEFNKLPGRPSCLEGHVLQMPSKLHGHILPSQEELVRFTTSGRFLASTLWNEFASGWLCKPATDLLPWTGAPIKPVPYKTRLRLVIIPAKAVSQLIANCRANGTTLTPLLHVLILTSLARRLPAETVTSFQSCTPIDLRPFVQPESHVTNRAESFGVLVTSASHSFDSSCVSALREQPSGEKVWGLAQSLRQELKGRVATIPQDDMVSMLRWVANWRGFWLNRVSKPREQTWEVSNIGSLQGSPEGASNTREPGSEWQILRSVMSQCAIVAGPALCASVSGVVRGPISIALSWQEGIIESELVEGVAQDLQLWMDQGGPAHGQKLP